MVVITVRPLYTYSIKFKHTSTFVVTEELAMLQLLLQIQLHAPLAKKDLVCGRSDGIPFCRAHLFLLR